MTAGPVLPAPGARWRRIAAVMFGIIALAGVIGIALHPGELVGFARLLTTARPDWLLAALTAQLLTSLFAVLGWWLALRAGKAHVRMRGLMRLAVAKQFLDEAMPMGSVSGILLMVHGLKRRRVPEPAAMSALFATVISYYAAYFMMTATSLAILWVHHAASRALWITTAVFVLVAVGIPAAVLLAQSRMPRLSRLLARGPAVASLVGSTTRARMDLPRRPVLYATTIGAQLVVFGLDITTFWFAFLALGHPCAIWVALVRFITASLAATLGPTPLGLGAIEGGSAAMLTVVGVPIERALAATLLFRGVAHWMSLLPGLILVRGELA